MTKSDITTANYSMMTRPAKTTKISATARQVSKSSRTRLASTRVGRRGATPRPKKLNHESERVSRRPGARVTNAPNSALHWRPRLSPPPPRRRRQPTTSQQPAARRRQAAGVDGRCIGAGDNDDGARDVGRVASVHSTAAQTASERRRLTTDGRWLRRQRRGHESRPRIGWSGRASGWPASDGDATTAPRENVARTTTTRRQRATTAGDDGQRGRDDDVRRQRPQTHKRDRAAVAARSLARPTGATAPAPSTRRKTNGGGRGGQSARRLGSLVARRGGRVCPRAGEQDE